MSRPPPRPPELEPLLSVPDYALRVGISRSTAHRDLFLLYAVDVKQGNPTDWFVYRGRGKKIRINVSRLEAAHPERIKARVPTRDEYEELAERVTGLEVDLAEHKADIRKKLNAQGAAIRDIRGELREVKRTG